MEPLYFPSQVSLSLPFFREANFFAAKAFVHGEEKVTRPLSQLQQALVCLHRWYVIPSPLPQFGAVFAWDFRQKNAGLEDPQNNTQITHKLRRHRLFVLGAKEFDHSLYEIRGMEAEQKRNKHFYIARPFFPPALSSHFSSFVWRPLA